MSTSSKATLFGSCLCKTVQYEAADYAGPYVYCHCTSCRKASGSAFAANIAVPIGSFQVKSGSDALTVFESSPGKRRYFCGRCGSPIYTTVGENPKVARVRLGSVDSEFSDRPAAHIFVGEKAHWHNIDKEIRAFSEWPDSKLFTIPGSRQGRD